MNKMPGPTRECRRCRADLPLAEFYRCKHRADGLSVKCKACYYLRTDRVVDSDRVVDGKRERRCTGCGKWRLLNTAHFHRRQAARLGYNTRCIDCYRDSRGQSARNPRAPAAKPPRFSCAHCCDLTSRDCAHCGRVASETLERPSGWSGRESALENPYA